MYTFLQELPFGEGVIGINNIISILIVIVIKSIESMLIVSVLEAIQIPYIYKFGVEKAKMMIFVIMAVLSVIIALIIGGIFYWLEKWGINIDIIQALSYYIYIALIFIIYNVSYRISCKIYKKKEF